ncbi:hypothetical protein ACJRO7_012690 [Eucalyptus globulus]|uniref:HORMA domain-containing protein n=1 Tax=Eucalyptus globulus TaxID=34317 RepID=A0ABD3LPT3_EUCGL
MVVAQKLKEAEITEQDSLLLTRNLLRIAIFNISYIRGLFPEKYFSDKSVPALEMKIKKLMPMDAESRRMIDWMEKGVYDALQKKYLKTLLFCVCESVEGPMIEQYAFSFSYSSSDGQEVSMNISCTGNKKRSTFKSGAEITPNQMRSSACKMVRTLVQLMRTLDRMPEERTILMKLLYYDDVTPADYEPPFFRCCSEEEAHNQWMKNPLKMEVGHVNSKHLILALKVKSVLDPCGDENDDSQDDEVSLGGDSMQRDDYYESDSEVNHSADDHYIVVPIEKRQVDDNGIVDEDDTQDPVEDEQQLARVKDWIYSHHLGTVRLTDILSNFPDISLVLIEEIVDKLDKEGVISKTAKDTYTVNKHKASDFDFPEVKLEGDGQVVPAGDRAPLVDEHTYMKALCHSLPMKYVTVTKLQDKLSGEANQATIRKLVDRMVREGLVEAKGSRRLGKRVIHSDLTEKKLSEAKKALENDAMAVDTHKQFSSLHPQELMTKGNSHPDMSTCGILHSIGSDLTRMKVRSDQSDQTISGMKGNENTPTSRAKSVASRESFIPGNQNSRTNGPTTNADDMETVAYNGSTQDKQSRKTSTVKDPILQYSKRQKSQAL